MPILPLLASFVFPSISDADLNKVLAVGIDAVASRPVDVRTAGDASELARIAAVRKLSAESARMTKLAESALPLTEDPDFMRPTVLARIAAAEEALGNGKAVESRLAGLSGDKRAKETFAFWRIVTAAERGDLATIALAAKVDPPGAANSALVMAAGVYLHRQDADGFQKVLANVPPGTLDTYGKLDLIKHLARAGSKDPVLNGAKSFEGKDNYAIVVQSFLEGAAEGGQIALAQELFAKLDVKEQPRGHALLAQAYARAKNPEEAKRSVIRAEIAALDLKGYAANVVWRGIVEAEALYDVPAAAARLPKIEKGFQREEATVAVVLAHLAAGRLAEAEKLLKADPARTPHLAYQTVYRAIRQQSK